MKAKKNIELLDTPLTIEDFKKEKSKKQKDFRSIETLFRNALRSNLELTSLADAKANILISINGFILTIIITASGLYLNNPNMIYPFITIMLTALVSIVLGTMAIRPRDKRQFIKKEHLTQFNSIGYFQDMSETSPYEYLQRVRAILKDKKSIHEHIIKHIHILGLEIKVKYLWLKRAYTAFGVGLSLSAILMIIALFKSIPITPSTKNQFLHIYEPSGAVLLNDGKVLLVEDESRESLKLVNINKTGSVEELNTPIMSKETKNIFKNKIRDLEGVTSNGSYYIYAITSHSTNKKHKHKIPREQIVRFRYHNKKVSQVKLYHGLLDSLKLLHPKFKKSLFKREKISRKEEINIEALTWDKENKNLLIGLRGPLINNKAVIVPLKNPDDIFDKKENPKLGEPILLDLKGNGIRGMSWDNNRQGYWIIAGDVGKRKKAFSLWFWDKKYNKLSKNREITNIGFAEGITYIDNIGIFIVRDDGSAKRGRGATYNLIREK